MKLQYALFTMILSLGTAFSLPADAVKDRYTRGLEPAAATKTFKTVPELVTSLEALLAEGQKTYKEAMESLRNSLPPEEAKKWDARRQLKFKNGQQLVQKLLQDAKMADHFKKRQLKELLKVQMGMSHQQIVSLFKTSEDDLFKDPSRIALQFLVRNAYQDIVWANDEKGGARDYTVTFDFSKDNKLIELSVEVPGMSFTTERWNVK